MELKKKWYKRYKLISFDDGDISFFGDGEYCNKYKLKIQVEYLWGLFTRIIEIPFTVTMFSSPLTYESHWQELIENNKYL